MRILITGASGFIGRQLATYLENEHHEVIRCSSQNGSIEEPEYFDFVEQADNIDLVYHLAGRTFVPLSWKRPLDFSRINLLGTQNTLDFCVKYDIPIVHMSSYVYNRPEYLPIDEAHPIKALNPYALSKKFAEELCEFYGDNYGLKYNIVRPFNVYGKGQSNAFLIPHILDQIKLGDKIKVKDLTPKRDFIYSHDVLSALSVLKTNFKNGIYNIGTGQSYSVEEVIQIAQKISGTELGVEVENISRRNELNDSYACTDAMMKDFNWLAKYSLEKGLSEIILST